MNGKSSDLNSHICVPCILVLIIARRDRHNSMPESLARITKQQFIRVDQTLLSSSSSLFFWRIKKPHQLWSSDSCSEDEDTTGTCWSRVLFGVQVLISLLFWRWRYKTRREDDVLVGRVGCIWTRWRRRRQSHMGLILPSGEEYEQKICMAFRERERERAYCKSRGQTVEDIT